MKAEVCGLFLFLLLLFFVLFFVVVCLFFVVVVVVVVVFFFVFFLGGGGGGAGSARRNKETLFLHGWGQTHSSQLSASLTAQLQRKQICPPPRYANIPRHTPMTSGDT